MTPKRDLRHQKHTNHAPSKNIPKQTTTSPLHATSLTKGRPPTRRPKPRICARASPEKPSRKGGMPVHHSGSVAAPTDHLYPGHSTLRQLP